MFGAATWYINHSSDGHTFPSWLGGAPQDIPLN
jgi:hypothetical protein